jgi:hypothetical protein
MTIVYITDIDVCYNAANWCLRNLKTTDWKLNSDWPACRYAFAFADEKNAVLFSLNWVCA